MKKVLSVIGLMGTLFFFVGKINAGVPMEQIQNGHTVQIVPANSTSQPSPTFIPPMSYWNTSISVSSAVASGSAASIVLPVVQTTMTFTAGATISTYTARNCITDVSVNLSSGSTFYLLDGNTTSYVVSGLANIAFSGATASVWTKHWDHLGPWCGTAGNTTTLSIPAPGTATTVNSINADGYTVITGLAGIYNNGQ